VHETRPINSDCLILYSLTPLRTAIDIIKCNPQTQLGLFEFINIKKKGNSAQVAAKCHPIDIYLFIVTFGTELYRVTKFVHFGKYIINRLNVLKYGAG